MNLKPQDIVVVLALALKPRGEKATLRQADVASALGLSQAEVNNALRRAAFARLFASTVAKSRLDPSNVHRRALLEFVLHGLKYAFPARLGAAARGVPTAWGYEPIRKHFAVASGDIPVWPNADGEVLGPAVEPLWPKISAEALRQDAALHEALALIDCLRVGRVRDREHAIKRLTEMLT